MKPKIISKVAVLQAHGKSTHALKGRRSGTTSPENDVQGGAHALTNKMPDRKTLVEAAFQSLLNALRKERSGNLAFRVLKDSGEFAVLSAKIDRRTAEEKARDYKIRAAVALMGIVVERAEAYECPLDLDTEESFGNHRIILKPVDDKKSEDPPHPSTKNSQDDGSD